MPSSGKARFIPPAELRVFWPEVRLGLQKVLEKSPEPWLPEDLYCDCHEGRAMLWLVQEQGGVAGFAVLQPLGDTLHIWAAHWPGGLEQGMDEIMAIAKAGGAKYLTFSSHRSGWEQQARRAGFRPRTYLREV